MAKQNAKLGFQLALSPLARTVQRAVAPATAARAAKAARAAQAGIEERDDFGIFSAAEQAFLDGLATARDVFSPAAVEARSNENLKSS